MDSPGAAARDDATPAIDAGEPNQAPLARDADPTRAEGESRPTPPPRVKSPLDAAFARPLVTTRITELFERKVVREQGPSLVAYGRFDPQARPVVLVHGIRGSGEELTSLADRLTRAGRQVYFFQYDDTGELTSENGRHLARALRELADRSPHLSGGLDIVAHSMGGLVTRVAMNTLAEDGVPRAGFQSVRVRTLDTPLDGFAHEAPWLAWSNPAARAAMRVLGLAGYYDMRGSSAMFEGLYATQLTNVTFSNVAARSLDGAPGVTRRAHDFSESDRTAIAAYLTGGPLPDSPRARNYARALRHDERGEQLARHIEEAQKIVPAAQALLVAYDTVMPQLIGNHTGPVEDEAFLERLVGEIQEPGEPPLSAAPR